MKKGQELFDEVFREEIEENGEMDFFEIQELDEVSCYDDSIDYNSGWYNHHEVTFRYKGKKYGFEYKAHVSVCDKEYNMNSFREVNEVGFVMNAINKIISKIESESCNTLEDIVEDLESLKRLVKWVWRNRNRDGDSPKSIIFVVVVEKD